MRNYNSVQMQKIIETLARLEANMLTKQDLRNELKNYPTKENLNDTLKNFATKEDLKNFATKEDLKNFATKADLEASEKRLMAGVCELMTRFPTREEMHLELANYPTREEMWEELAKFPTREEMKEELRAMENRLMVHIDRLYGILARIEETLTIFRGRLDEHDEEIPKIKRFVGMR